jgi:hypothetical protein
VQGLAQAAAGTCPDAGRVAAGARRSSSVARQAQHQHAQCQHRSASRHCTAAMAAVASSGTTSVPAPMPALAMPAARPRRRVNQGCTQAMAGV